MWTATRLVTNNTIRRCAVSCVKENQNMVLDFRIADAHKQMQFISRTFSNRKGFIQNLVESVKQEYSKDTELKENIKKFRQEAQELEDSEALKKARQKFDDISRETSQGTEVIHEALGKVKSKISETAEEISKSDIGKAAERFTDGISDAAKQATESEAYKKVQVGLHNIAQGSGVAPSSLYRPPAVLRMRKDPEAERIVEVDADTTNIVMHKDSVWNQQWDSFKNSKVGERISELRMQYDESDNVFIRGSRFITDKISGIAGGMFGGTDISKIMTEIEKIHPGFSAQSFLDICRYDVIPNVLEAVAKGKDAIVKDWCSEAPHTQLMYPVKEQEQKGYKYEMKIIDLDHIEIAGATKVDQGPVLVVSFQTQQIVVVRNKKGDVMDGDENQVNRVHHVWALCRDLDELDPRAAWKIIDQHTSSTPMLL